MTRKYKTLQEIKNLRNARFFIVATLITGLLLFLFGLPLVIKFASFLGNLRQSSEPVEIVDTTPPAPPRFTDLAEFTNKKTIKVEATAEPATTVTLSFNGKEEEVVVGESGNLEFTFTLKNGENKLFGFTTDSAGNKSKETDTFTITFDDIPPDLEITSPASGSTFYGASERQVVIEGKTSQGANVTINDRFVSVQNDGSFSYATTLADGGNNFVAIAKDEAGNETKEEFTLTYIP